MTLRLQDFDYELPESFIAQEPVEPRDSSKLMVLDREHGHIEHKIFRDMLDELNAGDVLVLNNTRVIPARLKAHKLATGGGVEILLLRQEDEQTWRALLGGRKPDVGTVLGFEGSDIQAEIIDRKSVV